MTREDGIKELTDRYLDLFNYAFSMLKNKADAEDAVQESIATTLSRVLLRNPYGFCIRVLHHRCIDLLRNKGVHQQLQENMTEEQHEPSEKAKKAMQLLEELPEQEKLLVKMHDIEEVSSREIAERLSMSASNVKRILKKAHDKLRKQLSL